MNMTSAWKASQTRRSAPKAIVVGVLPSLMLPKSKIGGAVT